MKADFPKRRQKLSTDWRSLIREHSPYLAANIDGWKEPYFDAVLQQAEQSSVDMATVMKLLRHAKRQVAMLTAVADLKQEWDDVTVMARLSDFADFCVKEALRHLLLQAYREKKIRTPDPASSGVAVIALGKWGAHELNYSSDIDLMVIFDADKAPVTNKEEVQNFFIRLTRDLARLLDQPTEDGYVFRTDLRLRPDPGAMPLAISIAAAETYYSSLGQNWERAAMIKARPVAGDPSVGKDFMSIMNAWIWRRNLDFATIQDIHSIKRQINAKQKHKGKGTPAFLDFNVKLGHGGIREIEFFVQTQQLIYGGREPALRVPDTLSTLSALEKTGHITTATKETLADAYLFLRRTEHRLQMREDLQTHSLPSTPAAMEKFAAFMGYPSAQLFLKDFKTKTDAVKNIYAELFTESPALSKTGNLVFTGVEDDPETLGTLKKMGYKKPETVTAAVRGWHHGRYRAVRSERARQILTEMVPHLLETLGQTSHPDDAFIRFDLFLSRLPSGIPIFSMFQHNPQMPELVADIMGTAPAMAEHLGRHPDVLQGILSKDFFGKLPDMNTLKSELNALLEKARDYEDKLDIARRFARDRRFHAGIHILKAVTPIRRVGHYLSDIAEASVTGLLPHIEEEFAKIHGTFKTGEFALIVLGSFAARRLAIDSDLDIVAVYDTGAKEKTSSGEKPLAPNVYYIRLMQRILTALTAPTAEGTLYDVDTRLRPAGHDGPLAVRLEGFAAYHREQSWTWEHMSLISSRIITPDSALKKKLEKEIRDTLTRQRDPKKLRHDVLDMRAKIEKQFGTKDPWNLKYRRGGMMDILFAAHYLTLRHAAPPPDADVVKTLHILMKKKQLSKKDGKTLADAYELFYATQHFLRLTAEHPFILAVASDGLKKAMAQSMLKGATFKKLEKQINDLAKKSRDVYQKIFKNTPKT